MQWQQTIFTVLTKSNVAAFHASFPISQITSKESQSFMDGERVKERIMNVFENSSFLNCQSSSLISDHALQILWHI